MLLTRSNMRNFMMFLMIAGFTFAFVSMFQGNNFQSAFSRSRSVNRNTVTNANSIPNQETSERVLSASASTEHSTEEVVSSHGSNQTTKFNTSEMVILYVFFGILFCSFIKELEKKIGIPYAATIIIISI